MKTRLSALCCGVLLAGFLCPARALDAVKTVDGALASAKITHQDILFVYLSPNMGEPGKLWIDALDNSSALADLLGKRFIYCKIELPATIKPSSPSDIAKAKLAIQHGIGAVPAIVLADEQGRPYARLFGGIMSKGDAVAKGHEILCLGDTKKQRDNLFGQIAAAPPEQKEALTLRALEHVPLESWLSGYPNQVKNLKGQSLSSAQNVAETVKFETEFLDAVSSIPGNPDKEQVGKAIERMESLAKSCTLSVPQKQMILLSCLYPLYVKQTALLYNKATNGKVEESFNKSVEILETVRDMDRSSAYGQKAHALREELRKARLAAAKYD